MRGSTARDFTFGTCPTPATSGWSLTTIRHRTGRWTPWSTRCFRTGSPSRHARCSRVAGATGCPTGPFLPAGRIRSTAFAARTRASSSTAATSTGSPTTSTTSSGSGPTCSTSPRSSRPARTIGTTRRRSGRSTRCSAATRRCAGSPRRPTDEVCASSATSRPTTPATPTSGSSPLEPARTPPNATSTSGPRGRDYVGWLGVRSLPKLNWDSAELRRRFLDDPDGAVRRWLGPAGDLDGWRVDVANMTGRQGRRDIYHQVAAWTRDALAEARPDALLVAEHGHDYSTDLPGDGWHGVMNYVGFTKPVWTWLCDPDDPPEFLGLPTLVPHLDGERVVETMREFTSHIPWTSLAHSLNLIGSHDTTRARTLVDHDPRLSEVAAGLLLTMPSIPMVTYGDEIGMEGGLRRGRASSDAVGRASLEPGAVRGIPIAHRGSAGVGGAAARWAAVGLRREGRHGLSARVRTGDRAGPRRPRGTRPGRAGRPATSGYRHRPHRVRLLARDQPR